MNLLNAQDTFCLLQTRLTSQIRTDNTNTFNNNTLCGFGRVKLDYSAIVELMELKFQRDQMFVSGLYVCLQIARIVVLLLCACSTSAVSLIPATVISQTGLEISSKYDKMYGLECIPVESPFLQWIQIFFLLFEERHCTNKAF